MKRLIQGVWCGFTKLAKGSHPARQQRRAYLGVESLEDRMLLSLSNSVAVGDLNNDGLKDLAVGHWRSNTVNVLFSNGNGTFRSGTTLNVGQDPVAVAIGDLNHDGYQDLAVANYGSNSVSVLFSNGNGTFRNAVNLPVGQYPASVAIGDLNHDGYQDLAVANSGSNTVSVLFSNGNGTFRPATTLNVGQAQYPVAVAVGDFNNDGYQDLAVADFVSGRDTVSVLFSNGNGTFRPATTLTA